MPIDLLALSWVLLHGVGMEVDWVLASPCLYVIVCSCYLLVVLYLSTLIRDGTLLSIWRPGPSGEKGQKGPFHFLSQEHKKTSPLEGEVSEMS